MSSGYVYLIQFSGKNFKGKAVKIGGTNDISRRIKELKKDGYQGWEYVRLLALRKIPANYRGPAIVTNETGWQAAEKDAHHHFDLQRMGNTELFSWNKQSPLRDYLSFFEGIGTNAWPYKEENS